MDARPPAFSVRFPTNDAVFWSQRYMKTASERALRLERQILEEIAPRAEKARYLTKPDLLQICAWKSPRPLKFCKKNSNDFVEGVTRVALTTKNEQLRIESLTLLRGVEWPVASAILHVANRDPYPILDWRALWSLRVKVPTPYDFHFWESYTGYCRKLAKRCGVTMRDLDRALWQYSKDNQK